MNPDKSKKRLALDLETVRVLQSDELAQVAGGAGEQALVKLSVTVSVGGNCKCCVRGGGGDAA